MQRKINKEIRHYEEELVLGLTLRQLLCSAAAIGLAVLIYLATEPMLGQEAASWLCMVPAVPVAAAGFFTYDGLTFAQFAWAVLESTALFSGPRIWRAQNQYADAGKKKERRNR